MHALIAQPVQAVAGLVTIAVGLLLYATMRRYRNAAPRASLPKGDAK